MDSEQNIKQKRTLCLIDDTLILDFPYDPNEVAEIKAIQGAKWDRVAKVWRVPVQSIKEVRQFAVKYEFDIETDVLLFDVPDHKNPGGGIYLEDDYLYMSFRYDPVMVRSVKQIEGVTWDSKTKAWKAPITSIETVIKWAQTFKQLIPDDVIERATQINEELNALRDASRSTDADIDIPTLNGTLLPYQRAGVAYASSSKRVFIADEMGLGKTVQGMAALEQIHLSGGSAYPAVVICPPSLVLNWRKEYERFLPDRRVAMITNRKELPMAGTYDVVIIGYSNIPYWEKYLMGHNGYIFDESHYCKSRDTQRARAARKMTASNPDAAVLCLTGTPITNRPAEYASQLEIIGQLDKFGGLWGFYRRYCDAYRDKWGQWNLNGNSNLDELNDKLRSTCYIRRTKDQVMKDLPPVMHSPLIVDGAPTVMKEYEKAKADIVQYLVERAKEIAKELGQPVGAAAVTTRMKAEANKHLMEMSILRKMSARAKMPIVYEWIDERIESGKKVVVAAHHREIVNEIANKYGNLKIQGGMSLEDVELAKGKFQSLPTADAPVIVLSIQAAKTGHTLTAAQDVLFVEFPWTPADVDQTYSRCHRIGQVGSVTATYMMAAGTIDEDIYRLIEKKRKVVDSATDGEWHDEISAADIITTFLDGAL